MESLPALAVDLASAVNYAKVEKSPATRRAYATTSDCSMNRIAQFCRVCQSVTLTATVSSAVGTPQGNISLAGATLALSNEVVSRQITAALTGYGPAVYSGALGHTGSSGPINLTVTKASTTTTLAASPKSVNVGQLVTLTATVSVTAPGAGAPTGTVAFFDGASQVGTATLSSGMATTTVAAPSVIHPLTAVYQGDGNFNGSTSAVSNVLANVPCTDAFGSAVALTGANAITYGTTAGATGESGEPNHAGNSSTLNSVWCKWAAPQSGSVTFDTTGSSFDTTLAVYTAEAFRR